MIVFPEEFEKTKYPGYFWNTANKKLYSCKSGVLKPLKFYKASDWFPFDHFKVSYYNKTKPYLLVELMKIKPTAVRVKFPVQTEFEFNAPAAGTD